MDDAACRAVPGLRRDAAQASARASRASCPTRRTRRPTATRGRGGQRQAVPRALRRAGPSGVEHRRRDSRPIPTACGTPPRCMRCIEAEMLRHGRRALAGACWMRPAFPARRCRTSQQMLAHEQTRALGILQQVPGCQHSDDRAAASSFDGQRPTPRSSSPALGADTADIFSSHEGPRMSEFPEYATLAARAHRRPCPASSR